MLGDWQKGTGTMPDAIHPLVAVLDTARCEVIDSALDPTPICAAVPGKRLEIIHLFVSVADATLLTFKSGSTAISGPYSVAAAATLEIKNNGFPVLIGDDIGEAITAVNSAQKQVSGFAVVVEVNHTAKPK